MDSACVLNDDAPKKYSVFNSESAKAAAAKSVQSRRDKKAKRELERSNLEPKRPSKAVSEELELVIEQIALTRTVLNDTKYAYCEHCERSGIEPHHRAQLLRALDGLLDRKRILEDRPLPGSRRPAAERKPRQSSNLPDPTPSVS